jgi:hypothetical protein
MRALGRGAENQSRVQNARGLPVLPARNIYSEILKSDAEFYNDNLALFLIVECINYINVNNAY